MRVLVAEDDEALRSVLERGLRENGYVVDALPDGERALAFLRTYDYDVAVLDWRMPNVSGLEVIRELRGVPARRPDLDAYRSRQGEDRVAGTR